MNYVLNMGLLLTFGTIIVTGILISRTLGLQLGIDQATQSTAKQLHILASDLSLLLVGAHVAVHWKWILQNSKKYLLKFRFRLRRPQAASTSSR